jgi:hypothetical protein
MNKEEVILKCGEVKLFGELHILDETPAPGISVCYGMKYGFHAIGLYRKFAEEGCREDFVFLVSDFRGCGKSEGGFSYGIEEQKDVKCAIKLLLLERKLFRTRFLLSAMV